MDRSSPCGLPLADGYTYIRAPLPAACGYGYCLLGVKLEGNRVAAARVAVPGAYADHPPEGLEGGVWVGVGSGAGYWVTEVQCPDAPGDRSCGASFNIPCLKVASKSGTLKGMK